MVAMLLRSRKENAAIVPMDGFHLCQEELVRQGKRQRMGAPDTFDVSGYCNLLRRLRERTEDIVYAPTFRRDIEEPIAGAIAIAREVPLIFTEGNYLLLDSGGWENVLPLLDEAWYLDVPQSMCERQLMERRLEFGDSPEHAREWIRTVDRANDEIVRASLAGAPPQFSSSTSK